MRLSDFLASTGYDPVLLEYRDPPQFYSDDAEAIDFLLDQYADEGGRAEMRAPLRHGYPYSPTALAEFRRLGPSDRETVLAMETVVLHELTHHIDYLTTPFCAHFHVYLIREFEALAPLLPWFASDDGPDIRRPIVDAEEVLKSGSLDAVGALVRRAPGLETYRGVPARHISHGWPKSGTPIRKLFGRQVEPVTIVGDERTIRSSEGLGTLLSARAVVEAHALGNCLRWVLMRFENDFDLARSETVRYLRSNYPGGGEDAEYRLIFDLVGSAFGGRSLEAAILGLDHADGLKLLVETVAEVAWFGLHGPRPATRVAFGLGTLSEVVSDDPNWLNQTKTFFGSGTQHDTSQSSSGSDGTAADPMSLIESAMDRALGRQVDREVAPHPQRFGDYIFNLLDGADPDSMTVEDRLDEALEAVRSARGGIAGLPHAPRHHYDHVTSNLEFQLDSRIGKGYLTPRRGVHAGHPLAGEMTDEEVRQMSLAYEAPEAMERWSRVRSDLLYGNRRSSDGKRAAIREYLAAVSAGYETQQRAPRAEPAAPIGPSDARRPRAPTQKGTLGSSRSTKQDASAATALGALATLAAGGVAVGRHWRKRRHRARDNKPPDRREDRTQSAEGEA